MLEEVVRLFEKLQSEAMNLVVVQRVVLRYCCPLQVICEDATVLPPSMAVWKSRSVTIKAETGSSEEDTRNDEARLTRAP